MIIDPSVLTVVLILVVIVVCAFTLARLNWS